MNNKVLAFKRLPKHDPAMANVLDEIERAGYTDPDGKTLTNDRHWHALRQAFELIRDIDPVAEAVMVRDVLPGVWRSYGSYQIKTYPTAFSNWISEVWTEGVFLKKFERKPTESEAVACAKEWLDDELPSRPNSHR